MASPPTEADIQEEEEEVQEELEHVENGIRYGNGAPTPVAHAQPRSTSPLLLPIPIPFPALPPRSTNPTDDFNRLAHLPTVYKPLPSFLIAPFVSKCSQLAETYLSSPSERSLFDILALVKVGLVPALRGKRPKDRIADYPQVQFPEPEGRLGSATKAKVVTRLVESGRLGSGARALVGEAKVAEVDEQVVGSLRSLHPVGGPHPFGDTVGPSQGRAPKDDDVMTSIHSFKADTAPGISGWTVPLLRLAAKSPKFVDFLTSLTASVSANTAVGASMLCASRLTPLLKDNGKIRPIAVGELFYRLATKTILRVAFKPDFLEKYQLGVGSKGGVEPIVRAVERALEGSLDQKYTHITSLDGINAFNTLERSTIAEGLRKHAKVLYRTGRWAYGSESTLLVGDHRLTSSSGVRQGDPLGPLFFSLGVRDLLAELSRVLGPNRRLLVYLDDIFILSTDDSALDDAIPFFHAHPSSLRLNEAKCETISIDEIKQRGWKLLGTCVGPALARKAFLEAKVDKQVAKLANLKDLPHQHALLLLRQCLQQDLRHLQRTLKTDDIEGPWDRLDEALAGEVRRMRSRVADAEALAELDRAVIGLPVRLGGMGVLSYRDCARHAFAAATEASDLVVNDIFDLGNEETTREAEVGRKSQRERCQEMFMEGRERIMANLGDAKRKVMVESASIVGRKWLSIIPYYQPLRLTDFEIASALHRRTIADPSRLTCRLCGNSADFGHDEVCNWRKDKHTIARHDQAVAAFGTALATLDGRVDVEPHTYEGRRRNDLRVQGGFTRGRSTMDYDVKIYSLMGSHAHQTTTRQPTESTTFDHAASQSQKYLASVAKIAETRRPWAIGEFQPLVFSLGGLMEKTTANEIGKWRKEMKESVFETMIRRLSVVLIRAWARVYEG